MKGRILPYLAVLVLALVASYAIASQFSKQTHYLCEQGNKARILSAEKFEKVDQMRAVLADFAKQAANARFSTYLDTKRSTDLTAAKAYTGDAAVLNTLKFPPSPLLSC